MAKPKHRTITSGTKVKSIAFSKPEIRNEFYGEIKKAQGKEFEFFGVLFGDEYARNTRIQLYQRFQDVDAEAEFWKGCISFQKKEAEERNPNSETQEYALWIEWFEGYHWARRQEE